MAYGAILGQSFESSPVFNDYYTKQQTLSDSTAALYGLGTDAVPDDAFRALFNPGKSLVAAVDISTEKSSIVFELSPDDLGYTFSVVVAFANSGVVAGGFEIRAVTKTSDGSYSAVSQSEGFYIDTDGTIKSQTYASSINGKYPKGKFFVAPASTSSDPEGSFDIYASTENPTYGTSVNSYGPNAVVFKSSSTEIINGVRITSSGQIEEGSKVYIFKEVFSR